MTGGAPAKDTDRYVEENEVGDTLTVHREVVEKEVRDEDWGRVDHEYEALNQNDETVFVCRHLTLVERQSE